MEIKSGTPMHPLIWSDSHWFTAKLAALVLSGILAYSKKQKRLYG